MWLLQVKTEGVEMVQRLHVEHEVLYLAAFLLKRGLTTLVEAFFSRQS